MSLALGSTDHQRGGVDLPPFHPLYWFQAGRIPHHTPRPMSTWTEFTDLPAEIFEITDETRAEMAAAWEPLFTPEVEQRLEALCAKYGI